MTAPPAARFTREEYLRLPKASPGFRFELVDGELVTMNDPLALHQEVVGALYAELRTWCRAAPGRGRVLLSIDTEVDPETIVGPDLQWFAASLSSLDDFCSMSSFGDVLRLPSNGDRLRRPVR